MHHLEEGEAGMVAGINTENCGDVARAETGYLLQNCSKSLTVVNSRKHQKSQTTKQNCNTPPHPQSSNKAIAHPYSHPCFSHFLFSKHRINEQTLLGEDIVYLHLLLELNSSSSS